MAHQVAPRSYLYAPGSNERIARSALGSAADAVILDLEDAVADTAKAPARDLVAELVTEHAHLPLERHVRVNLVDGCVDRDELAAVVVAGLDAIRLPKVTRAAEVARTAELLDDLEVRAGLPSGRISLWPTIESAAGAAAASEIVAAPRVVRLAFGATDFMADIGARDRGDGLATLHVRSRLVLVSRAAGVGAPVDSVHTDLDDHEGLRAAAEQARDLGYSGKSVIHPRQLDIVHEVFSPSTTELAWANRVIAAWDEALARDTGALSVEGQFVDAAVIARARDLLARARHAPTRTQPLPEES